MTQRNKKQAKKGVWRRRLARVGLVIIGLLLLVGIIGQATPWPAAMLIRNLFEQGGAKTQAETARHVPNTPLVQHLDVQYGDGSAGKDTTMDVFSPESSSGALPTIVWIHGGAWISGEKENVKPYLQILAGQGYTTIGLNYTYGPEAIYPTAVNQLNNALGFINQHAAEYRVDPNKIILAGDSAGSQLASQLAVLITNPDYAFLTGMNPPLKPSQLIGTILNCGVYDLKAMAQLTGINAWGFKIALWAYTGTKDWSDEPVGTTMSTINFVTKDFPPTFIAGGNGDGLTWLQSVPMEERLKSLGVKTTSDFWPENHTPALPHEYQLHLDSPEAQQTLQKTIKFLGEVTQS